MQILLLFVRPLHNFPSYIDLNRFPIFPATIIKLVGLLILDFILIRVEVVGFLKDLLLGLGNRAIQVGHFLLTVYLFVFFIDLTGIIWRSHS